LSVLMGIALRRCSSFSVESRTLPSLVMMSRSRTSSMSTVHRSCRTRVYVDARLPPFFLTSENFYHLQISTSITEPRIVMCRFILFRKAACKLTNCVNRNIRTMYNALGKDTHAYSHSLDLVVAVVPWIFLLPSCSWTHRWSRCQTNYKSYIKPHVMSGFNNSPLYNAAWKSKRHRETLPDSSSIS
jgi:hypothetical protein